MNIFNLKQKKEKNLGFSLIELMVTIAIISVLSGIAISVYPRDEYKLKKVLRGISTDIQRTKMAAIRENKSHAILFNAAGGYTIYSDPGADNSFANFADNTTEKTFDFVDYNSGINWDTAVPQAVPGGAGPADGISYANNLLTLNARGFCNQGYVYFNYRNNRYAIGTFASGIVILRRWDGAVWQ
jgi:prepilin-type N-terminal cleavage/methylation domain-containing protein